MDQNRLYYGTPYVKSFMCTVLSCTPSKKGTWEAVFDQTGFYPEGGGQPYDTGTINGISVLSVHERAGEIVHELAEPIEAGIRAEGIIDWNRRYDLMQQHTGEHILSGLVHRHFGYDNVGFHMGADEVTIDFNGVLTQEQLEMLEDEANEIVYANVPVKVLYPSDEELKNLEYRSKKELTEQVRIVEIPGADVCACCGTHVERTGEVGIIKTRTMIHYKGGVRISMLCGRLALLDYRNRLKDEIRISNFLSAKVAQVPEAVEKLKQESQQKDGHIGEMWRQIFQLKLAVCPESHGPEEFFEEGMEPLQLRQFATLLYEQNKGRITGVFSGNDEAGLYQYALGSSQADMRTLSKAMNDRLEGRGGGSMMMAQGTLKGTREEIRLVFLEEAGKL